MSSSSSTNTGSYSQSDLNLRSMPEEDRVNFGEAFSYKIGKEIGKGQYGVVYKGVFGPNVAEYERNGKTHCKAGQKFAVKFVNFLSLRKKEWYSEAQTMTQLEHEYIINVFSVITVKRKRLYIFMEFADCGSLSSFLKKHDRHNKPVKIVSERKAKRWCVQMLSGLQYINSKRMVHQDVHMGNILMQTEQTSGKIVAKISDFGLTSLETDDIRRLLMIKVDIQRLGFVFTDLFLRTKFTSSRTESDANRLNILMKSDRGVNYMNAEDCLKDPWITAVVESSSLLSRIGL